MGCFIPANQLLRENATKDAMSDDERHRITAHHCIVVVLTAVAGIGGSFAIRRDDNRRSSAHR
jgi:hypothetical protein